MAERVESLTSRISAIHVVIVLLSLTMTLGAWLYSKKQVEQQIEGRFDAAADQVIRLIVDRMTRYEDALWSGVAKISARTGDLTYGEWKAFAATLRIEEKYPGVNGIGVIYYLERPDLAGFLEQRTIEREGYSIFPEHDQDILLPITYIEPENINAQAVGLDVAHETNRREALLASRDTGTARITGPIVLVQDSGHTPGFLFYTPFYAGETPQTVAGRRENFEGVVYAPFVMRNLVEGLLARDLRNVTFSIRDEATLLYDEHATKDSLNDPDPWFSDTFEIDMYGRNWVVDVRSDLAFRAENGSEKPTLILIGGLVIEILVITLVMLLARANRDAHNYAHRLTAELRAKSDKLEKANKEIEQFVYIASHDLKTPTRGIGFLTDMIEEDIDERFGPLPPDSELKSFLGLIRERIERMNALAAGIMEYSRVGQAEREPGESVSLQDVVRDCVSDFGVREDQVQLESNIEAIDVKADTFRRVLENLIGNAFKYHPERQKARVEVRAVDLGDKLQVSVRDNGVGIAPEYHEKIFEVFQTLQSTETNDSTGIGLAIVKKSVQSLGGDVSVSSAEGKGAMFTFQWPKSGAVGYPPLERVA